MAKRLLVIDPICASEMIEILKRSYEVDCNLYKEDAAEKISRGGYDGFFMTDLTVTAVTSRGDVDELYCENGLELVRLASEKGLPTVVVTGAAEDIRKKAEELGAKKVLEILVEVDEVLRAFKEAGF